MVWEKSNPNPINRTRRYVSNIEMFSWFVKDGEKWTFNMQNRTYDTSVFKCPAPSGDRVHPCQKPLPLLEALIKRHTNEGDTILDPFMGSGSVGIACMKLGRKFIGIEKEQEYFNSASQSIQECPCYKKQITWKS